MTVLMCLADLDVALQARLQSLPSWIRVPDASAAFNRNEPVMVSAISSKKMSCRLQSNEIGEILLQDSAFMKGMCGLQGSCSAFRE
jgi:hypothetical protein